MSGKETNEELRRTSSVLGDSESGELPDEATINLLRIIDRKTIMHPFTPLSRWEQDSFPIITGASGSYLIDEKQTLSLTLREYGGWLSQNHMISS